MTNGEEFLLTYNKIEQLLRKKLRLEEHIPFQQLIKVGAEFYKELHFFRHDLIEYAQLRNAIVHNRNGDKLIAEPLREVVDNFELIYKKLSEPKKVIDILNHGVFLLNPKDSFQYALKIMRKYDYTTIPVYEKDKFLGVFNTSSVTRWLTKNMKENEIIEYKGVLVEDILLDDEMMALKFVSEETSVYDVRDIYKKNIISQNQIDAIIITETGDSKGKPLMIFTTWDMPKILENL